MSAAMMIDAARLRLVWDRLISTADAGAATLIRTSFSTVVREGYDLSVMVFDADGMMLAQSTKCIPVFIGTAPVTMGHMLRKFPPGILRPGDVLISNDPVIGTGHMFDIAVMQPIFDQARISAYPLTATPL